MAARPGIDRTQWLATVTAGFAPPAAASQTPGKSAGIVKTVPGVKLGRKWKVGSFSVGFFLLADCP
jgi:hypothetical protein